MGLRSPSPIGVNGFERAGVSYGEPIYNKVKDFALEFYSDGRGEVRFAGYSVFSTNEHGAYTGNLLASDGQIEESIACCLSP